MVVGVGRTAGPVKLRVDEDHLIHDSVVITRIGHTIGTVVVKLAPVERPGVYRRQGLIQTRYHLGVRRRAEEAVAGVATERIPGAAIGRRVSGVAVFRSGQRDPTQDLPLDADETGGHFFVERADRVRPPRGGYRSKHHLVVLGRVAGGGRECRRRADIGEPEEDRRHLLHSRNDGRRRRRSAE